MRRFMDILTEKTIHYFDMDDTLFDHGGQTRVVLRSPTGTVSRVKPEDLPRKKTDRKSVV